MSVFWSLVFFVSTSLFLHVYFFFISPFPSKIHIPFNSATLFCPCFLPAYGPFSLSFLLAFSSILPASLCLSSLVSMLSHKLEDHAFLLFIHTLSSPPFSPSSSLSPFDPFPLSHSLLLHLFPLFSTFFFSLSLFMTYFRFSLFIADSSFRLFLPPSPLHLSLFSLRLLILVLPFIHISHLHFIIPLFRLFFSTFLFPPHCLLFFLDSF